MEDNDDVINELTAPEISVPLQARERKALGVISSVVADVSASAAGAVESKEPPRFKSYNLANFRELPQIQRLGTEIQFEMEVVGSVLPFKTNNYVVEQLIDWDRIPDDPMFVLTFPQKGMLTPEHYTKMEEALRTGDKERIQSTANEIRRQLNPHPAGQVELNVPTLKDGTKLHGMQRKYRETCLFFPGHGQTCHAYCGFCFRWPQFVRMNETKFAAKEGEALVRFLKENEEISDVLFTGGDPMVMKAKVFSNYVDPLLQDGPPNLRTIRIGTKSLSYWPYKFLGEDGDEMLGVFKRIIDKGINLSVMAHFNHPAELGTDAVKEAIRKIRSTGAQIRTQSPVLRHVNDNPDLWAEMWTAQVQLGCVPYYMFVVRDTGAQHYFGIPLVKAQEIFRDAYSRVSGLARTVRGPSMSASPGKIQILGAVDLPNNQKALALRFIQARNPDWVQRPFLAQYDEAAVWLDDLKPVTGDRFFFE